MATWVKTRGNSIPEGAIRAGYENDGHGLFIARYKTADGLTPGKCGTHLPGAYIPFGGKELIIDKDDYEVLVQPISENGFYEWKHCSDGNIPERAVWTTEQLYVGRARLESGVQPGKVFIPHKTCYVSYAGKEYANSEYEVLCKVI